MDLLLADKDGKQDAKEDDDEEDEPHGASLTLSELDRRRICSRRIRRLRGYEDAVKVGHLLADPA